MDLPLPPLENIRWVGLLRAHAVPSAISCAELNDFFYHSQMADILDKPNLTWQAVSLTFIINTLNYCLIRPVYSYPAKKIQMTRKSNPFYEMDFKYK